jgi:hypothetical protein
VGNVLNVNTGDWVRRDSGVGAGIDSYYEYVAKVTCVLHVWMILNFPCVQRFLVDRRTCYLARKNTWRDGIHITLLL